jgi:hypothetical protein
MCQIVPQALPGFLSESDLYDIVNTLPVDYQRFAQDSHYGARMYGVLTGVEKGGSVGDFDHFAVNSCLRYSLWQTLVTSCQETERVLGYNLTPRYHLGKSQLSPTMRLQMDWAGIESTGLVHAFSDVLQTVTLSPYVETGLTPVVDGAITYVEVSTELVGNPKDVILRSHISGGAFDILLGQGYPKKVGTKWRIALNIRATALTVGDTVDVQSRQHVFVDVDSATTYIPFYPGTTQKIPLARPVQALTGNVKRYWFYVYTLVDPAFYDDTEVDLVSGELYKLNYSVDLRTESETPLEARITQKSLRSGEDDVVSWKAELMPLDPLRGIFDVKVVGKWEIDPDTEEEVLNTRLTYVYVNRFTYTTEITYAYKTNPNYLPDYIQQSIASVLTAILHRVAADLPLADCGCKLERGFIAEQQKSYATQLVTPTGIQMMKTEFGDLHGHKVYAEKMSKVSALKARIL